MTVHPSENCSSAGSANGIGNIAVIKTCSLVSQTVDVWSAVNAGSIAGDRFGLESEESARYPLYD